MKTAHPIKLIAAVTTLALTVSLSSCGGKPEAQSPSNSSPNPQANSSVTRPTESPRASAIAPDKTETDKPNSSSTSPDKTQSWTSNPVPDSEEPSSGSPSSVEPPSEAPQSAPAPQEEPRQQANGEVPVRPIDSLPPQAGARMGNIQYLSSETTPNAAIEQAIIQDVGDRTTAQQVRYYYDRIDLNGDGNSEALVYLNGSYTCGSGGCTLLVLEPQGQNFQIVSSMTLVNSPVIVSSERTDGWNDLIIKVEGGGAQPHYARLQYGTSGTSGYPGNPSTAPEVNSTINGTAVITDEITPSGGIAIQ
ncbi:MAG: hypothetical protein MUF49_20055 [Oculatellaceae cyanobacterium Prado106]|jgi:hypothetical protein|nr:hypothetical protein [Oculatellaceae cyanobacterium Prado106]